LLKDVLIWKVEKETGNIVFKVRTQQVTTFYHNDPNSEENAFVAIFMIITTVHSNDLF